MIDIAEANGSVERLVVAHADPAKADLAQELKRRYPPPADANHIVSRVIRTGEPDVQAEVTDKVLVAAARLGARAT